MRRGGTVTMAMSSQTDAQALMDLARDRSRGGRARLYQTLSDLFIGHDGNLTDRERTLITGIVDTLTTMVDADVRQGLVRKLMARTDGPVELYQMLARDTIDVARPILRDSGVLQDADLVGIIRHLGNDHAAAIALRSFLSEVVTDALIATGDPDVIVQVLSNDNAALSPSGRTYLANEAQRVPAYQRPLLRRRDAAPGTVLTVFWAAPSALRRHILETVAVDDIAEGLADGAADTLPMDTGPVSRPVLDAAATVIAPLKQTGQLTSQALMDFVRAGRVPPFIAGLARYCDLPMSLCQRACQDATGEPLAVICKSFDLTRNDFASLFLMLRKASRGREPLSPRALNEILTFYDGLKRDRMAAIARYWAHNLPPPVTVGDPVPSIAAPQR